MRKGKGKGKPTNYLLFCPNCYAPKEIARGVFTKIWAVNAKMFERCTNCKRLIEIPEYLKKIARELEK